MMMRGRVLVSLTYEIFPRARSLAPAKFVVSNAFDGNSMTAIIRRCAPSTLSRTKICETLSVEMTFKNVRLNYAALRVCELN